MKICIKRVKNSMNDVRTHKWHFVSLQVFVIFKLDKNVCPSGIRKITDT